MPRREYPSTAHQRAGASDPTIVTERNDSVVNEARGPEGRAVRITWQSDRWRRRAGRQRRLDRRVGCAGRGTRTFIGGVEQPFCGRLLDASDDPSRGREQRFATRRTLPGFELE